MDGAALELRAEILFLIGTYLSSGPLQATFRSFVDEVDRLQTPDSPLLPTRTDWTGEHHLQTFDELREKYAHLGSIHLEALLAKFLDNNAAIPSRSLLGVGSHVFASSKPSVASRDGALTRSSNVLRWVNCRQHRPSISTGSCPIHVHRLHRLRSICGHTGAIFCLAFDQTGTRFVTGGDDNLVKIWCSKSGWLIRSLRGHLPIGFTITATNPNEPSVEIGVIIDVAISNDNKLLLSAGSDKYIRIWDFYTFQPMGCFKVEKGITTIAISPSPVRSNYCIAATCEDGKSRVWRWDAARKSFVTKPEVLDCGSTLRDVVKASAFNATGTLFVTGGDDGFIYSFALTPPEWHSALSDARTEMTPKLISQLDDHQGKITDLRSSPDGRYFLSTSRDGTLRKWSFDPSRKTWKNLCFSVKDFRIDLSRLPGHNPNFRTPSSADDDPEPMHSPTIDTCVWTADNRLIAASVTKGVILIWDSVTARQIRCLYGHSDQVYALEAHPRHPDLLLSGGYDGRVILWDIRTGSAISVFEEKHKILAAQFSPDGTKIIASDDNGVVYIYGASTDSKAMSNAPFYQFFSNESNGVTIDESGTIMDVENLRPAHHFDENVVVSSDMMVPYPQYERYRMLLQQRSRYADDELMESHRQELLLLLQQEQALWVQADVAASPIPTVVNKKKRYKHRKIFDSDDDVDVLNEVITPWGRAHSSGDEYSMQEDEVEEESDDDEIAVEERAQVSSDDMQSFVVSDDDVEGEAPPPRPVTTKRQRKRKYRQRAKSSASGESDFSMTEDRHVGGSSQDSGRHRKKRQAVKRREKKVIRDDTSEEDEEEEEDLQSSLQSADEVETKPDPGEWDGTFTDANDAPAKPKGRLKRRPRKRRKDHSASYNEDLSDDLFESSDDDPGAGPSKLPSTVAPSWPLSSAAASSAGAAIESQADLTEESKVIVAKSSSNSPSPWVSTTERTFTYLPQMGDLVVYFKEGHKAFLDSLQESYPESHIKRYRSCYRKDGDDVIFGRICALRFVKDGQITSCDLNLQVHRLETGSDAGPSGPHRGAPRLVPASAKPFKIKYFEYDTPSFLILYEEFAFAMSRPPFTVRTTVYATYPDRDYEGTVTKIASRPSPWQKYSVKYSDSDSAAASSAAGNVEELSPWELRRPGESRYEIQECLPVQCVSQLAQAVDEFMQEDRIEPFAQRVDYDAYPNYLQEIPYPVYLEMVHERLCNNYYRRIEALEWDLNVMLANALHFNLPGSDIYNDAKELIPFMIDKLREVYDVATDGGQGLAQLSPDSTVDDGRHLKIVHKPPARTSGSSSSGSMSVPPRSLSKTSLRQSTRSKTFDDDEYENPGSESSDGDEDGAGNDNYDDDDGDNGIDDGSDLDAEGITDEELY
ncbi:uncharacterized protein BJ171DRAFT_506662 [Polychytrium aggregatum]|uniref:uncharacterized protein n=1 Tax=Polychytrium aggregatum TaxID=110093 RepID=UPI0022FF2CC6|nr:uncharacterized protein BJ171DRAFT_506662 [Polychytrium aggregatum]KAI9204234.1 hypothetical protein BJ171DRAFT_506662 [Polychytrium aggregatum]